jgi:quercetin dioxygenase-like cupin family protein
MQLYHPEEFVKKGNPTPGERYRLDILTKEQNAKALAGLLSVIPPGGEVAYHYHERRESLIILVSGEMIETVEGKEFPVKPGDVIFIPAGEKHKSENRSKQDVYYLEFYTPLEKDVVPVA